MGVLRSTVRGAAAGAAGTTALNAATYIDMTVRARSASDTPEQTVERASTLLNVDIPGKGEERDNRVQGLGPLTGIATGVGVGALLGLLRGLGLRPPAPIGAVLATALALVGANGPMAALGISDPREWSSGEWAADVVPHVAYGAVTALVLQGLDRETL